MSTSFQKVGVPRSSTPGTAIRAAQQALEADMAQRIAAFNERIGASVTGIHIEYIDSGNRDGVARSAPLIRLTIET